MINPWLSKSRIKRVSHDLSIKFLGKKYRTCAREITAFAYIHPDWQRNFSIWANVNTKDEIESIEVREHA